MTLKEARDAAITSVRSFLTSDQIDKNTLESMVLKNDKLCDKSYMATWINRKERCKMVLKSDNIYDETCPVKIWLLAI